MTISSQSVCARQKVKSPHGADIMKSYYGNNSLDNAIDVDFNKKQVLFQPVGDDSLKKQFMGLWLSHLLFFIMVYIFILIPFMVVIELGGLPEYSLKIPILIVLLGSVIYAMIALKFIDKKWRKKHFPEYNYRFSKLVRKHPIFKALDKEKVLKLNPKSIYNKQLMIPLLTNMKVSYKATGDFKAFKRIRIMNIFQDNPRYWNMFIEWNKPVKKGSMTLWYL